MASVTATPGVDEIPRRNLSIEVVCCRDGYLEARMTFAAAPVADVGLEGGTKWRPPAGEAAAGFVGQLAMQGAVAFFPPAIFGVAALGAAGGLAEGELHPPYAYRTLPEFLLTPESFASEADREAFFDNMQARLEAAARAQRAYIDAHCRFWPCEPTDVACPDPVCERQRVLVDERLGTQLDQIPALRAQTRISAQ